MVGEGKIGVESESMKQIKSWRNNKIINTNGHISYFSGCLNDALLLDLTFWEGFLFSFILLRRKPKYSDLNDFLQTKYLSEVKEVWFELWWSDFWVHVLKYYTLIPLTEVRYWNKEKSKGLKTQNLLINWIWKMKEKNKYDTFLFFASGNSSL